MSIPETEIEHFTSTIFDTTQVKFDIVVSRKLDLLKEREIPGCLVTKPKRISFRQIRDRDQLVVLAKTLSKETSRFAAIQHALSVSTMPFFIDEETGEKYNLTKPRERLLGGQQEITFFIDEREFCAILKDPEKDTFFYRNENLNTGWKDDWQLLKKSVPHQFEEFYYRTTKTLIDRHSLSREDQNSLHNRDSATVDRQPVDLTATHYNISYQVGKSRDRSRYTYGTALIHEHAHFFLRTTGYYASNAISFSVADSHRYRIDVQIYEKIKGRGGERWQKVDDEGTRKKALEMLGKMKAEKQKTVREKEEKINKLSEEIDKKTAILSKIIIIEERSILEQQIKVLKSELQKTREELSALVDNVALPFVPFRSGRESEVSFPLLPSGPPPIHQRYDNYRYSAPPLLQAVSSSSPRSRDYSHSGYPDWHPAHLKRESMMLRSAIPDHAIHYAYNNKRRVQDPEKWDSYGYHSEEYVHNESEQSRELHPFHPKRFRNNQQQRAQSSYWSDQRQDFFLHSNQREQSRGRRPEEYSFPPSHRSCASHSAPRRHYGERGRDRRQEYFPSGRRSYEARQDDHLSKREKRQVPGRYF